MSQRISVWRIRKHWILCMIILIRLNARLEALGYTAHFEMKLTQPQENFDFEKDFLQNQTGGAPTSQYIFDIKA